MAKTKKKTREPASKKRALKKLAGVLKTNLSLRECTLLRLCFTTRVAQIERKQAGVEDYGVVKASVDEIEALFKKLTGYPLYEGDT